MELASQLPHSKLTPNSIPSNPSHTCRPPTITSTLLATTTKKGAQRGLENNTTMQADASVEDYHPNLQMRTTLPPSSKIEPINSTSKHGKNSFSCGVP